jgi:hypothetical protein
MQNVRVPPCLRAPQRISQKRRQALQVVYRIPRPSLHVLELARYGANDQSHLGGAGYVRAR